MSEYHRGKSRFTRNEPALLLRPERHGRPSASTSMPSRSQVSCVYFPLEDVLYSARKAAFFANEPVFHTTVDLVVFSHRLIEACSPLI